MNDLQHVSEKLHGPVFVTLNPPFDPDPACVVGRFEYDHPVLGAQAVRAQQDLPIIQHKRGISFAGAWIKYGFHEDGFAAGLRAATAVMNSSTQGKNGSEVRMPFEIVGADCVVALGAGTKALAWLFDMLEGTGLREILGVCLSWCLAMLRGFLGLMGVDLYDPNDAVEWTGSTHVKHKEP